MSVTEPVLKAKLATIQKRLAEEGSAKRCIGVISDGWIGAPEIQVDGQSYRVVFCASPLAVREQMDALQPDDRRWLVVITSCKPDALGADVQARVFRNQFQPIDPWQTVRDLFQARQLGPGVPQEEWLQRELVASTSDQRPALLAGTVLDLETVKHVVFRRIGLGSARPDVRELLAWADGSAASSFAACETGMRDHVRRWVSESAGKAGAAVVDCVAAGNGSRACALGLVLRIVAADMPMLDTVQGQALARAERFVGNRQLVEAEVRPWADAAEDLLRGLLDPEQSRERQALLDAADRLLVDLGLEPLAHKSSFLRRGLLQREEQFATELEQALRSGTADLVAVEQAAERVAKHELASVERGRAIPAAVTMAVRCLRWLTRGAGVAQAHADFRQAALAYASEGSFVDWAREQTTLGYPHTELQKSLRALWSKVQQRREEENRAFAERCAEWSKAPTRLEELVPLEQVVERVLAPLARQSPVLLLVLDGMSLSVFHELVSGMPRFGWVEVGPAVQDRGSRRYGVAVLPTLTEVSRTSLLTGRVQKGDQRLEREAFEALQSLAVDGNAPRLFHKRTLSGDRVGVEAEVQEAVLGPARVVGVVINAIDDWLGKGDQDAAPWEVERIKSLLALLDLAVQRGRVVLLTSDHGHVREHDSRYVEGSGSSRHRRSASAGDGELLVHGTRVCAPEGQIVVPWTESLRYCAHKQNGYHGGITPQEVLVPLSVFVRAGDEEQLVGWAEVPPGLPAWWEGDASLLAGAPTRPATRPRTKPKSQTLATLPFPGHKQDRIAALLRSPLFVAQRELAQRNYPGDDKLTAVLTALAEKGDTMTVDALASRLETVRHRLVGMLTALRRVLNVDGAEALELDQQSGTARVNWPLLVAQFELDEGKP